MFFLTKTTKIDIFLVKKYIILNSYIFHLVDFESGGPK